MWKEYLKMNKDLGFDETQDVYKKHVRLYNELVAIMNKTPVEQKYLDFLTRNEIALKLEEINQYEKEHNILGYDLDIKEEDYWG